MKTSKLKTSPSRGNKSAHSKQTTFFSNMAEAVGKTADLITSDDEISENSTVDTKTNASGKVVDGNSQLNSYIETTDTLRKCGIVNNCVEKIPTGDSLALVRYETNGKLDSTRWRLVKR